jgi:hypothetical protein
VATAPLDAACGGSEPAGGRAASSREAPAGGDPLDPEAPGLTDLARLSRYVFREMQRRGECALGTGVGGRIDYTLELVVEAGRIRSARLLAVSSDLGGFRAPLLPERWPASLVGSVECLEPHLRSLSLDERLRDGRYESRFSLGEPAETPRAAAPSEELPDPAEPGLPDLQRIARHLFREMHLIDDHCSLHNPLSERVGYVVEVEVRGGAIERAELTRASVGSAGSERELPREAWPEALEAYAKCLPQHLRGLDLEPAPADGVYRPDYAVRPEP